MPVKANNSQSAVEKMRSTEINPIFVIVAAVVLVLGLGYAFWLRPAQDAERMKREWISPEAQQRRSPEGRAQNVKPGYAELIQKLRDKEGTTNRGGSAQRAQEDTVGQ